MNADYATLYAVSVSNDVLALNAHDLLRHFNNAGLRPIGKWCYHLCWTWAD